MRLAASILLLIITLSSTAQNKQIRKYLNMPSYTEVYTHFYETHAADNLKTHEYIQFAKKPEGWFVYTKNYRLKQESQHYLLWDRSYKKIKTLHAGSPCNVQRLKDHSSNQNTILDFKRNAFMGYAQWASDAIAYFEPLEDKLNDTLTYALGRAYTALATNYTTNQFAFQTKPSISYQLGGHSLSQGQVDSLVYLNRKAVHFFKKTKELNPQFTVVVGPIDTKVANEYVDLYFKLWMYQDILTAESHLPSNLYTANNISDAKNLLLSCPKDAILFTNGDNDTYPLMYVQKIKGVRTDVSIINISMLGTLPYWDATKRDPNGAQVNYTSSFVDYAETTSKAYLLAPTRVSKTAHTISLDSLFRKTDTIPDELNQYTWSLTHGNDTFFMALNKNKRFMMKYRFLAYDLIMSNPTRPITFASTHIASELNLNDARFFNGFSYNLARQKPENQWTQIDNFMKNKMVFEGYQNPENFTYSVRSGRLENSLTISRYFHQILILYMDKVKSKELSTKQIEELKANINFIYEKSYTLRTNKKSKDMYEKAMQLLSE